MTVKRFLHHLKSIIEMIEVCNCIGTVEHRFETMAAAFAALKVAPGPTQQTCFGCRKPGHLKRDCHASKGAKQKKTTWTFFEMPQRTTLS